jgi:hypothetical protein
MSASHTVIFRDFKRHYHKVRVIADRLTSKGSFKLQVRFDGNNLQAEHESPDNDETVRFVVLMRRFLSPSDTLYFKRVWVSLQEQFKQEIAVETAGRIEAIIERLDKGQLGVNINGEDLTAERIYQTLSDGWYFDDNADARTYLESLADLPLVGPLFWHQFHAYALEGFALVSALFDVVTQIEKGATYEALSGGTPPVTTQCVYCLTTTATFTSEEHVFPESLGNDKLVLPKGYVCDKCNNGILAWLDSAFLKFGPVAMLQVQFVPYTKEGKLPKANFQNLSMERTRPTNIAIKPKDKTGQPKNKKHLGDGWYSFSIEMKGKVFDPKLLGRALYKIALGTVALSQGQEQACSPKFDAARDFICAGHNFPNNLLMRVECRPHPQVRIAYHDLPEGTPFAIDIYGLTFVLNLESKPLLELNDVLADGQFAAYSLCG